MVPRELLNRPLEERMRWAAVSALVGTLFDGPALATSARMFDRLEAACKSFEVPPERFDECAELLDCYYYAAGDCYVGKATLDLVTSHPWGPDLRRAGRGTRH